MADGRPKHLPPPSSSRRWAVTLVVTVSALIGVGTAWVVDRSAPVVADQPVATPIAPTTLIATATTTTRTAGEAVTLAFAGDMSFEGLNRQRLEADPASLLGEIAPTLRAADVAVGNLETALGEDGSPWPGKEYTFRAPASALDALRAAGFDAVSMANNHGMDYGTGGLESSLAISRAQPDRFVIGIGADEAEAYRPFLTVVRGQRIAVIAATQVIGSSMIAAWTATADQGGLASAKRVDRLVEAVASARAAADTVVVFLHWGIERDTCPSGDQQTLAATLAAAGADVIVGGHAHRLQGAGRLGGALVAYGLGNFLWNAQSEESAATGVLEVTVTGRHVDSYRWIPARIEGGTPHPLSGGSATEALAGWDALRACTDLEP